MGYLRKNGTVANPAKKSLTVFQNSYTQSTSVPTYGHITIATNITTNNNGGSLLIVYNESDVPIEWRMNGAPTVTLAPHDGTGRPSIDRTTNGYGDLYTKAGAYLGKAYMNSYRGNAIIGYTTQYSTKWNTKWSKLSA